MFRVKSYRFNSINLPFQTIGLELGSMFNVQVSSCNINQPFQKIGLELGAKGLIVRFVLVI